MSSRHPLPTAAAVTLLATALLQVPAQADTITFDDLGLPAGLSSFMAVPNGYHGLDWSNFWALNSDGYEGNPSGYQSGAVSGTVVGYNGSANPASISSATPFTFDGVYLTAAWNDGLTVSVTGWRQGNLVQAATVYPLSTAATRYQFNWSGVDMVRFESSGGTDHAAYPGSGAHIAFDNLSVSAVPEAATWALWLMGLGALSAAFRRAGRHAARDAQFMI